jgi:Ser/Thr protein kinase RdoA (MazF antagonist)
MVVGEMTSDSAVFNVLSNYTALPRPVQAIRLGGGGGFSGSQLWRITAGERQYCLRRWAAGHPDRNRLAFIHSVLREAASHGLPFLPAPLQTAAGATFISQGGTFWEVAPWLPGNADFWQHPTDERLRSALTALAQFHLATADCPGAGLRPIAEAPAVNERRVRLTELLSGGIEQLASATLQASLRPALDTSLRESLAVAGALCRRLLSDCPVATDGLATVQPAIRDIWHDHVLFTGDEVTGLVDFGAMRIDTPLADVARLIGSLVEDDIARRDTALAAYSLIRPVSENQRRLIDWLDHAGVLIGLANWATWLYVEQREFADLTAVETRVLKLAQRLQRWR